ncbi:hypothetical protein HELRODRAFT_193827 [Helobdella robusta]|uniref:Fanconi-associated nuclease n=1 Tax=Helobdella robusta TaxID=6412 RepID=T1FVE4_HELRO|nr:hypothetical protein HELRODRAFT_193827 [Helobdella robusta]ESN94072.1 hypothetical protein HELRODRAFT_193827 [Helobdella robusta]
MYKSKNTFRRLKRQKSNEVPISSSSSCSSNPAVRLDFISKKSRQCCYKPLGDLFALQQRRWDAMFDVSGTTDLSPPNLPCVTSSDLPCVTSSDLQCVTMMTSSGSFSRNNCDKVDEAFCSTRIAMQQSPTKDCCGDDVTVATAGSTSAVKAGLASDDMKNKNCDLNESTSLDTSFEDFIKDDDSLFSELNESEFNTTGANSCTKNNQSSIGDVTPLTLTKSSLSTTSTLETSITPSSALTMCPIKLSDHNNNNITTPLKLDSNTLPYYIENFKMMIVTTMGDAFHSHLFDESDRETVNLFLHKLTIPQQKLFTRLYLRKFCWLRLDQIKYNDISENLIDVLDSLVLLGLIDDVTKLTDLNTVLKCLLAPELKSLCKSLRLDAVSSKSDLIAAIINHSKTNSIKNFFKRTAVGDDSLPNVVLLRAKSILGHCYKLNKVRRSTFMRILILSSLNNTLSDDDLSAQQMIFQMLQTSNGKVKYPDYNINRTTKLFQSKNDLIMYEEILEHESTFWHKMEKKSYEDALKVYTDIRHRFEDYSLNDEIVTKHNRALPAFLRCYTASSAYIRILNKAVSLLQFLKRYEDAVKLLSQLLNQEVYHLDYRGRWFDRITLNLDFHLKNPTKALDYIKEALNDPWVKVGHRLDLLHRAKKILASKSKKLAEGSQESMREMIAIDVMNFIQAPLNVTTTGQQLFKVNAVAPSMWVVQGGGGGENDDVMMTAGRVEQVALDYYATIGYPEGIHGEGITLTTLFMLLSWDVVFMSSIPDVFYDNFQMAPLDFRSHDFYPKRKEKFHKRYQWISHASEEELDEMLEKCWSDNYGVICAWINWELFTGVEHVKGLVRSIGPEKLSSIFMRMAQNMRYVTGGVPDLIVWNPSQRRVKFAEVKGPGDKLSSKQILWLDFLLSIGLDAEVCHVKAENSKKIFKSVRENCDI